jgi:endonuclease/exonuclease/phosphatase family metal-dependent hydrolase
MKNRKTIFTIFAVALSVFKGMAQEVPPENKNIIRVLSFNILHGATTKGDYNLDIIAKVVNNTKPDLVALQEVDFKTNRAKKLDIITELALRTDMTSFFAKSMEYDGGEYGGGLLSKWGFLKTKNIALPHKPDNEPRVAAKATIIVPSGDTIQFIGTHLDDLGNNSERIAQVKEINKLLINNKYPAILAGDLNDVPVSEPIGILESEWGSSYNKDNPKPTFPSNSPEVKIDYVMLSPKNRWKVIETKVICDEIASDHCAYLVVLELLP